LSNFAISVILPSNHHFFFMLMAFQAWSVAVACLNGPYSETRVHVSPHTGAKQAAEKRRFLQKCAYKLLNFRSAKCGNSAVCKAPFFYVPKRRGINACSSTVMDTATLVPP
jgi:hypothetical protein